MQVERVPYTPSEQKEDLSKGYGLIRRLIFGTPIATAQEEHTLLPKFLALPIFASDAISSVAYATQQIVLALGAAGMWLATQRHLYTTATITISGMIVLLLAIVVMSYWQTIFAYPGGGGSYAVSKKNLGVLPGLVAAAALLIDYVLTVSVSIASGIQNLRDVPFLRPLHIADHMVMYCVLCVLFLTAANLRGLKESGKMFALPTYLFVTMCYAMILTGIIGPLVGWHPHMQYVNQTVPTVAEQARNTVGTFSLVVFLRAFANGCSAMTGTEAVSNGVPVFKEPKPLNAALTLVLMGGMLGSVFLGISWLAMKLHVVYWEIGGNTSPAVIDQISGAVFGKTGFWSWAYIATQVFTALILVLAANTSFAGFPRLASILARDGFMPRQLSNLGDRLVFNNGIIILGLLSATLLAAKNASVDALIPFYAIGVFLAFTLSQAGMVKHWFSSGAAGWKRRAVINGVGSVATALVLLDIAIEKFLDGAWFIIILLIGLVWMFRRIYAHYADVADQLRLLRYQKNHANRPTQNTVLVLVQGINVGTMQAVDYARSLSKDCIAIHVELDPDRTAIFEERWKEVVADVPLVVLESPFRSLLRPIMHYIDDVHEAKPRNRITVVIGEFVPTKWWQALLHGNTGLLLKFALLGRTDVVVVNVRYQLESKGYKPRKGFSPPKPATDTKPGA